MSLDEEYYIILHVGGRFVKDPYVRYVGGEVIRLKEDPDTVKFKEIDLYVKHEVDNPIIVGEMFLLTVGEGDDKGVESNGEGDLEKVESVGEDDVRGVQADEEGVSATGIEVDEYGGVESGGQISLGSTVGEDNDSEVAVDEYAGDFATSDGVDNITAASSGEEEDGNETE
ncbi:hypothetical protein Gogos_022097, partial [Gossypium gossypioides]|nr:hypothetical protein [Gossypium gossypioides]